MVMTRCTLFALLLVTAHAQAAPSADRIVSDTAVSADSDGQHQRSEYLGYVHGLPALGKNAALGLRAGYWMLKGPGDRIEFSALRLDHQRSLGPVDISLRAHQLFSDDWSPTLGAVAADYHVSPRWTLSAGAEAELVDTVVAARQRITFNTYNVSSDYRLHDTVTLVGGVLQQDFSDGNLRRGALARLIYSPRQLDGFNAQLRLRRSDSDFQGRGYFSPDRFEEAMAVLQYGHALPGERFAMTVLAGAGQQQVNGSSTNPVYLVEWRTRGWFNDRFGLETKAGCNNSGDIGAQAAGNGYRYCYGNLSLLGAW